MVDSLYVDETDKKEFQRFATHHIPSLVRPRVQEVWHYTSAEGLIGILAHGEMFFTHIACLNDHLEQRYFGDLVHQGVRALILSNVDPKLAGMLKYADSVLRDRDFSATWHFAACFSEVLDDLGQWRGYGSGECGYAIGFDVQALSTVVQANRPGAILIPMNYDKAAQQLVVDDVLRYAQAWFLRKAAGASDLEKLAKEFLEAFAYELDIFATMMKHPAFKEEREWRIATALGPNETGMLEFRQKRTLLARYLSIKLKNAAGRLPITRVFVGPSPAQRVSQVSVGDLLLKYGYTDIKVERSSVPYRVP
jgi:Protein of unknown function (DUF2971)